MSAKRKGLKSWVDGARRFATGLEDSLDRRKFDYLVERVGRPDPWDVPPELPQGIVKVIPHLSSPAS